VPAATQSPAAASDKEPKTAAARKAVGLEPLPEQDQAAAADGGAEGQINLDAPEQPAITQIPGGEDVNVNNLTPEELETIRMLRSSRGSEIRQALAAAPVGAGTDADPYVLRHQRGCPEPQNTETYDDVRPNGRKVTIQRCITCGAQNIIDH
jgi:hypothetical protein